MQSLVTNDKNFNVVFKSKKLKAEGKEDMIMIGFGSNSQGDNSDVHIFSPK